MSKALLLLLLVPLIAIAVLQVTIPDNDEGLPNWVVFHGAHRIVHLIDKVKSALTPAPQRVFEMTVAYWRSTVLRTITSLRVADAFRTAKKQSMTCPEIIDQLARLSPPVDSVHAPFFCRVLHASAADGLFELDSKPISLAHILGTEKNAPPTPKFTITETGALLDSQNPRGSYNLVMMLTGNSLTAWNHLEDSVHSGKSGFMEAYGQEVWDYHLEHDPKGLEQFNEAMRELSLVISVAARASYNFSSCSHICDIGGGVGTVGVQLIKNNPDSKATIFDLPFAEEEAHKFLKAQRVENRVNFVGGSFFNPEDIPKNCDCYVLKHILHDWDDESSRKILASVASALSPDDRVLLIEAVVGGSDHPGIEAQKLYMDLNMLASCPSGAKERSAHEYEQLFSAVGLSTTSITNTKSFLSVVEARLKK